MSSKTDTLKFLHAAGNMGCRRALKNVAGSNKLTARRAKELLVQKDSRARQHIMLFEVQLPEMTKGGFY